MVGLKRKELQKKKKDEKDVKPLVAFPHVNYKMEPLGKSGLVETGDILSVYYGDKHNIYSTTYDAKVISCICVNEGYRYYVHYVGWNSRYDEWVDHLRICSKRGPDGINSETGAEPDTDVDPSKNEQKKLPPTRTRRSITPSSSSVHSKKSPFSNGRQTRTCTLGDQPSTVIENSDSESEFPRNLGMTKQYNKRNQQPKTIKSEHNAAIKTEVLVTDNQKKSMYPKTYPSKEVLMQRNIPKKSKSCVFKVHSNKSEEIELCEQVTLKAPLDLKSEMPPPTNIISNIKKENIEIKNEDNISVNATIEEENAIINYVSSKEALEKNDQQNIIYETPSSIDGKNEINIETTTSLSKSQATSVIFYKSSSEDKESVQLKIPCEELSLPLSNQPDESKISGTDFDLNEIRSEMKGLLPTSTISNIDLNHSEKSVFQNQFEIEEEKNAKPETEDIYEFKESEPCDFETIPSVIEEKNRRVIKYNDSPKSYNFEKTIEPPIITESVIKMEVAGQNQSVIPNVSNSNNTSQFYVNIETNVKENDYKDNLNHGNEVESSVFQNQSDIESDGSENLIISDVIDSKHVDEDSRDETCQIDESDMKNEVLDLCMKPPESPPNNIFSMPEPNDINDMAIEDEDDEDDDELKLVIADDKIDTDYQIETNLLSGEEHNSSREQTEEAQEKSPPPMPPSVHQLLMTDPEDFKNSFAMKRDTILPRDTDDESTTSCNENIQNDLVQSFQMYSNIDNQSPKTKIYQPYLDNNDDSTKSGFEFGSNSKSPTFENAENVELIDQFSTNESTNKEYNYEINKFKNKSGKEGSTFLPELQCREEIIDEESLNNALVIEYSRNNAEYDIHKPSTSKGHFDSIHQPCSSKSEIYETNISSDTKNNSFIDAEPTNVITSVIFDAPSSSRNVIIDDKIPIVESCKNSVYDKNVPIKNQSSLYDNPIPSTSKVNYNSDSNVNDVLFCEETIPGSPTGTSEEQFDNEETKRTAMEQDLYEEREAASAMYAMNRSFQRPMVTLMGASEAEMEEYTRILKTDGTLDQTHLQFLAEISSRNQDIKINEPPVTEPSVNESPEPEPEPIVKPKLPEKSQTKRKNSHEHSTSKRNKSSTITTSTIQTEKPEIKTPIPMKDGKPLIAFTPDMDSTQRQALILARINDLRKEYIVVKTRISVVDRRRKKIRKRKREMTKIASIQNKQSSVINSAK
uniref:Tudor-knot domain-containing protein n=1 Tax=Sipha flava TaxID=143950 RepID=A0A2S2R644_9HEMI